MKYCIDIDGTICSNTWGDYKSAIPYFGRIQQINELYETGNHIILFTARGSGSGIDWTDETKAQLKSWNVKYHELIFGKPEADIYVDDRASTDIIFFGELDARK